MIQEICRGILSWGQIDSTWTNLGKVVVCDKRGRSTILYFETTMNYLENSAAANWKIFLLINKQQWIGQQKTMKYEFSCQSIQRVWVNFWWWLKGAGQFNWSKSTLVLDAPLQSPGRFLPDFHFCSSCAHFFSAGFQMVFRLFDLLFRCFLILATTDEHW